jgi:DNA invertase Pin-like site-specific DNA recombinase
MLATVITQEKPPVRVAIYCRMSHESDNVKVQEADCRELVERRGWEVSGVYVDDGVSAYRGRRVRRAYRELMADLQAGSFAAIAVYNVDRLQRSNREFAEFVDACEQRRIHLVTPTGDVDTTTADGRLYLHNLGAAAEHQSARASERLRRKHRQIAEEGRWSGGGKRAYGFEKDGVTIRESEAAVIREFALRALAGESLLGMVTDLNRRGIPAAGGGEWRRHVLKALLRSARISGQREHLGVLSPAVWLAIVSPADTLRLRELLRDGSPRTRRTLLTGLLRCGRCGRRMGSRPDGGRRAYACRKEEDGCGGVSVVADWVEERVTGALLYALDHNGLRAAEQPPTGQEEAILRDLEEARGRLTEVGELHAQGAVSTAAWLAAVGPLERRIEEGERGLASIERHSAIQTFGDGNLGSRWTRLTVDQQRAILRSVVDTIDIAPVGKAKVGREDRVSILWRA